MAKKYISQFTGEEIDARLAAVSEKVGGSFFDSTSNTIYFFKSIEDRDAWVDLGMPPTSDLVIFTQVLSFEGEVKKIDIEVDGGLLQYYTTTASSAPIKLHYYSKVKGITDAEWEYIPESADVTISVQRAGESTETVAFNGSLQSSLMEQTPTYLTVDLKQYLSVGTNTVKVVIRGKTSETESKTSISATLTTMSLYANDRFNWHIPCLQTGEYQLGGFFYTGNIQKTLNVRIANYDGNGAEAVFTKSLGYDVATDVPDSFTLNDKLFIANNYEFPSTGVHQVDVWITAGTVRSDMLSHDIMFVRSEDANSAQLVVVNDVAKSVINGTESAMFYFALYDGVNVYASSPTTIDVYNGSVEVVSLGSELTNVETKKKVPYVKLVDVSSDDNEFTLSTQVTFADITAVDTLKVDNSANFPAESGAIFYFNAANRTNQDAQREKVLDEANNKYIDGNTYVGFSWVDGMDGYTVDDQGNRCFRVPAGSKATFNVAPFASVSTQNGISFELVFKVVNAANETDDIITIYDNTLNAEAGVKIKPTNVLLHSSLLHDEKQMYHTKDEELVHCIVSLIPNHTVNGRSLGYGIAQIYVNGTKKTLFEYDPKATQSWGGASKIDLGSLTAELFLYKIRTYNRGFVWKSSAMNYVNSRLTRDERSELDAEIKSIVNESYDIDYYKCVEEGKNVMVIEMLNGAALPDLLHEPGEDGVKCNVLFNFPDVEASELDDDFSHILHSGQWQENRDMEGQGSTAMTYHRWNFRWKKLLGADNETERRVAAKKNVASSMQDHKMGATRLYNDVYFYLQSIGKMGDTSIHQCPRVAVYQYPAFGFQKVLEGDEYVYKFIGLYTVGPDKGDKLLFDFKNKQYKNTLIHIEGADHTPLSVGFDYPWKAMDYDATKDVEALGAIATKLSDGTTSSIDKAWEVGAAGGYETDSADDKAGIMEMLTREFKPAYEVAYNNSPFIIGITQEEFIEMNADVNAWRGKKAENDRDYKLTYSTFEFYVEGVYDLYYHNKCSGVYEPVGINLKNDFGLSDSDITARYNADGTSQYLFREKRRERFKANWTTYWHKEDTLYHYSVLQLLGVTDNFKKNTYPYKFAPLADGGKWRWRQDDLDTIFDVDNTGLAKKSYEILVGDTNEAGVAIYKGDNSVLWLLIRETQADEIEAMTKDILDAMCALSRASGVKIQQALAYIDKTFWQKAQRYFGVAGYNEDSEWTYEESHAINPNTAVDPLDQASGDHFEAEYNWVYRRLLFMASLLRYGTFTSGAYQEEVFGKIQFRATGSQTLNIIPSISMTPTIILGESSIIGDKKRVFAGETYPIEFAVDSSADTIMTLPAADYLADIGDFSGIGNANGEGLNLSAKRLRKLKMGGDIPEGRDKLVNNFSSLTIANAPSLEELNCKNCWNLQGTINLSGCKRIKSVDISGTKVSSITFPEGCKVTSLLLPSTYVNLTLKRFPSITMDSIVFDDITTLNTLELESNALLNGYAMLKKVVETEGHLLKNISIIGFNINVTGGDIMLLSKLATAEEGGYYRYQGTLGKTDAVGVARQNPPKINGTLNVTDSLKAYEADVDIVNHYYDANIVDYTRYVPFEDPEVQRISAETWGDGVGVTEAEARAVGSLNKAFANSGIQTFNELNDVFSGVTTLTADFQGCTSLREVDLTNIVTINDNSFNGCTGLIIEDLNLPKLRYYSIRAMQGVRIRRIKSLGNLTTITSSDVTGEPFGVREYIEEADLTGVTNVGNNAFYNCTALKSINLSTAQIVGIQAMSSCSSLKEVDAPVCENLGAQSVRLNPNIERLVLPKVEIIGNQALEQCPLLSEVVFDANTDEVTCSTTLRSIGNYGFYGCASLSGKWVMNNLSNLGTYAFMRSGIQEFEALNVTGELAHCFRECQNLERVNIPKATALSYTFFQSTVKEVKAGSATSLGHYVFHSCYNLEYLEFGDLTEVVGDYPFMHTSNLKEIITPSGVNYFPKLNKVKLRSFNRCGLKGFDAPILQSVEGADFIYNSPNLEYFYAVSLIAVTGGMVGACPKLDRVVLRDVETIAGLAFTGDSACQTLVVNNTIPPELDTYGYFAGINVLKIYVPDSAVDTYKSATNWSGVKGKIYGISQLATDRPDVYNELTEKGYI